MKLGLQVPWFSWPGAPGNQRTVLADIARTAEDAGFSSLWVMDHFFQLPALGPPTMDMHEAYTTLGYLAGVTETISLGALVTGVTYRAPALLVKEVTTLDVLSGGRAWFGLGAGWFELEHRGLGVRFPTTRERFELLEEALQIAHQMWSEDDGPYRGKHNVLDATICAPQPLSEPHPPIMIGGGGEKKTLRLVAQYADASNLFGDPGMVAHKISVMNGHCETVGRDPSEITVTRLSTAVSADQVRDQIEAFEAVGVGELIYNVPAVHTLDLIREIGKLASPGIRP